MGFLSIFQRKADASPPAAATQKPSKDSADDVMRARVRARQRLIGAAVLVVIGIVGFPLVFETQPRPIPVDIPIEIPRKDGAPALVMPPARAPRTAASVAQAAPKDEVITESRDDAGKPVGSAPAQVAANATGAASVAPTPAAPAVKPAETKPAEPKPAEHKPEAKPEAKSEAKATEPKPAPESKPAKPAETKPAPTDDSVRAKALLEGKEVAAKAPAKAEAKPDAKADSKADTKADTKAEAGRFVVQVGAFADATAARETRLKVEKLGLKTYTQVASTANGNRIRVRVGPFASRDEADKALAKAKSAGLTAVVLTL